MIDLTAGEIVDMQAVLFDTTITVYGVGAGTGAYDTPVQTDLAARFVHLNVRGATSAVERSELLALRQLRWAPAYLMPEADAVQIVDADGLRWQPTTGSFGYTPLYRYADVVRVPNG